MMCEPACSYVTHFVPTHGHIHHALTCPNHPVIEYKRVPPVDIPEQAKRPVKLAVETRRDAVAHFWNEGRTPSWLAARFICSESTIKDDIRWLRVQGRIGRRPRQLVTMETLRNERC